MAGVASIFENEEPANYRNIANKIKDKPEYKNIEMQSLIKPKLLADYMDAEKTSYPKELVTHIITEYPNSTKVQTTEYILDVSQVTEPYRLYWQLLAALDALDTPYMVDQDSNNAPTRHTSRYRNAIKDLQPEFAFGDSQYFQRIEKYAKSRTVVDYADPSKQDTSSSVEPHIVSITKYPLAILESVKTPFAEYHSTYAGTVKVNETEWIESVSTSSEYTTKITYKEVQIGNLKIQVPQLEQVLEKTVTTYSYTKEITYEDTVQWTQVENLAPFYEFMEKNDIKPTDLYAMFGIISALPNNSDVLYHISNALDEFGYDAGGQYSTAIRHDLKTDWIPDTSIFEWPTPTSTRVTSQFGMRFHPVKKVYKAHKAIDIAANLNDPIIAAADGVVTYASYFGDNGNTVIIKHENGVETRYSHLNKFNAVVGQTVTRGSIIGYAGTTGVSTGVHLHFEVRINNNPTDPLSYYIK